MRNEYAEGYDAGYADALDDAREEVSRVLDVAAPKCYGVVGWLRGQLRIAIESLRGGGN